MEVMNMEIKMTKRLWKLYEYLKDNDDRWVNQTEIYNALKSEYGEYDGRPENFHDSYPRLQITYDIQQINQSDIIQKIILSSSLGVKIANEEEYRVWSLRKWKSIKRMISRLVQKDKKAKLDGQVKLVFGDSMARNFYETFARKESDKVVVLDLDKSFYFTRTLKNYDEFRTTLREMIQLLKDFGQYEDGMTEEEIREKFADLYEAGAFA